MKKYNVWDYDSIDTLQERISGLNDVAVKTVQNESQG